MQQFPFTDIFIDLFEFAVHVTGDKLAHLQEHFWLYIQLCTMHRRCGRPVTRLRWNWANSNRWTKRSISGNCCILLFADIVVLMLHGLTNVKWYKMSMGLHMKCRYSCQILMQLEFSRQIFVKYWKIKFPECPSSGSRVVPCRRTARHVTKLIVAFRNVANVPTLWCTVRSVFKKTRRRLGTEMGRIILTVTDVVKIDWTGWIIKELRLQDSNTVAGRQRLPW